MGGYIGITLFVCPSVKLTDSPILMKRYMLLQYDPWIMTSVVKLEVKLSIVNDCVHFIPVLLWYDKKLPLELKQYSSQFWFQLTKVNPS